MIITKLEHSCLLVEVQQSRLLIDPGSFSKDLSFITGLTAILYTHDHGDHYDSHNLDVLVANNPNVSIYANDELTGRIRYPSIVIAEGMTIDVGSISVRAVGTSHAVIHPDMKLAKNTGFLICNKLFHPGDSFTVPNTPVEILALPIVAPWAKIENTIEYVRNLNSAVVIPIHDAITNVPELYIDMVKGLCAKTKMHQLQVGETAIFPE